MSTNRARVRMISDFDGVLVEGDPTGVSDSYPAFMAAKAKLGDRGGRLIYPPGYFKHLTSPVHNFIAGPSAITLHGQGIDATILDFTDKYGPQFNYAHPQNSVHLRDFSLVSRTNGGGIGISLLRADATTSLGAWSPSTIERVLLRGYDNGGGGGNNYWTYGIYVKGVSGVRLTDVVGWGGVGTGTGVIFIGVAGSPPNWNVAHVLRGCSFANNMDVGIIYEKYTQGVRVSDCDFLCGTGIYVPAGATAVAELEVTASQFACAGYCIRSEEMLEGLQVNGGFMAGGTGCIRIALQNGGSIIGCKMQAITPGAGVGVTIDRGGSGYEGIVVAGNVIKGFNVGVSLTAASLDCKVGPNTYQGCVQNYVNSAGATNTIVGGG